MPSSAKEKTSGSAAAALLAAGIGIFILGALTTLKASNDAVKRILSFYPPTGPLSGQTAVAVAVWLAAWVLLAFVWRRREINLRSILIIFMVLIALGFLACFPPLFEAFFEAYE
jgi:uncharacterized membrane protein